MDNCQKNVNLSTEREFIHTMDNCLWHGQAMKCPLTVCLFVSLVVSDQNCPQDLDLSRKILTSLTDFLGPCVAGPQSTFGLKLLEVGLAFEGDHFLHIDKS